MKTQFFIQLELPAECNTISNRRPKRISSPLGIAAEVSSGVAPGLWDVWAHLAYRIFPDSAAARGDVAVDDERPSGIGRVFARLLPGIHW